MAGTFRAPKGTYDIVPPAGATFEAVLDGLLAPARRAGYAYVEAPVFEPVELFVRGVGESTDVVTKEMFTFTDRGDRSFALRPEGTAGVVRAVLEHGLHQGQLPVKLRYAGPMFRAERPQAGRFRQFQQVGIEALGLDDPALDAEVVALGVEAFTRVGLTETRLLLTSLGDAACRPAYRTRLTGFLERLPLDDDTRRRAALNPLRLLDDKRPELQDALADAPLPPDHLCADCRAHYDAVRGHLSDLGIGWTEAPRLVRGLDYYTRTTFEFVHDRLGAQSAVGGGGRYDGLSEALGGPPLPSIGWALGVERTLLAREAEGVAPLAAARCAAFVVPLGPSARRTALRLAGELRAAGVPTDLAFGDRGLKGAMKAADRSGASYAVVLGDRDLADGVAQVKDLASGEQAGVPLDRLAASIKERLT